MKSILNGQLLVILLIISPLWAQMDNETCMECHSDPELTKEVNDSTEVSLFVNDTLFHQSIHQDLECVDCHAVGEDHPDGAVPPPTCGNCHEDEQAEYEQSIHGMGRKQGIDIAATCWDCHGTHNIQAVDDTSSMVYGKHLLATCSGCHSNVETMRQFGQKNMDPVRLYKKSIHGRLFLKDPEANVATCISCHGSHNIKPVLDPTSSLNILNIPKTCGQCHKEEMQEYEESVHWKALSRGHFEAPNCTYCHGEHDIESLGRKTKFNKNPELRSTEICAGCHSSQKLMSRYGLDYRRFESYFRTYHGLAVLKGSLKAATCGSCHENHAIRSRFDPKSTIYPANLQRTCSQCHSNVTESFARIEVHPIGLKNRNYVAYLLKVFYKWMIILVIGGMFLHNVLIVVYHIRQKLKAKKYSEVVPRFQTHEVYLHVLLFLSFATLALTGFALKFPDAGWVKLLYSLGMNEPIRSTAHRIAAIIMGTISIIQLFYFIFSAKGRREFLAMLPNRMDLVHVWQNIRFYLGLSKERPKFDHFDYGEKAEYLALIWGIGIMGLTGFMLWFPEFFARFLPSWYFEATEIIHYYEAWLASLAILIWHWFFVIYHPEQYPLNVTCFDGKITLEELKHHHPLEYERLIKERKSEKQEESK